MTKLRILWFNWRCWLNPAMGGAEVFTREVAKRLVEKGNSVTLFTSSYKGSRIEEVSEGVRIVRDGGRFSVYSRAKKFYRHNHEFDLIIDEINTRPFLTPCFVRSDVRVVALIHQLAREYWFYEVPFPASYLGYYYLEKKWLSNYTNVPTITVSESSRQDLVDLGFKNLFVVPEGLNFTPLDSLPEKNAKPIVVYSGRLKRAKRPDHALKVYKILKERFPDAELWFFGDGPLKKKLEKIRKKDMNIKLFGNLENGSRRKLISQSWVLVNPSVREGWGLNITEANALGVPAVAYDVSGLRDSIKNGQTGLLAESANVNDLAKKTSLILENGNLRKTLSRNAFEDSRKFSWDNCANSFLEILEGLV